VPHLLPIIRGIHSTLYGRLNAEGQAADLQALFETFYAGRALCGCDAAGSAPETRSVRASNTVRIAVHKPQPDTVMVLVVEDNLTKGASGQAVQCMNLMFGLAEQTGPDPGARAALSPTHVHDARARARKTRVHGKVRGLRVIIKPLAECAFRGALP
jgi:N-acetyl-gamma-glutamylphosphate reductase